MTLLCPATVIIGFKQLHYKVTEGDGCVEVCVELLAGQLKPSDSISFIFDTIAQAALGKMNSQGNIE